MSTQELKRSKKGPWSEAETELLVEEIIAFIPTLDSKFGKKVTNSVKNAFWRETTEKVNSIGGKRRTEKNFRKKWTDLKSTTKLKEVKRRKYASATAGGPAPKSLTPLEEKVISVLASESIDGIEGGKDTTCVEVPSSSSGTSRSNMERTEEEQRFHYLLETTIERTIAEQDMDSVTIDECIIPEQRPDTKRKEKKERTRDQMIMDLEHRQLEELIRIRQSMQNMETSIRSMGQAIQNMDTSMKELVRLQKVGTVWIQISTSLPSDEVLNCLLLGQK